MGNLFCGDFYEPQTGLSIPKIDEEPIAPVCALEVINDEGDHEGNNNNLQDIYL